MAAVTAAAVGVAAVGASLYGSEKQAQAARQAGQAQDAASQDWLSYSNAQKNQALGAYSEYVPAQQAAVDKAMHAQQLNLERQQKLVESINPALLEAGQQMTKLLQGQSAPVLQNLKDQRQTQRQGLLDSLRQQLGPGGETSQMGMNALRKFDADTANQLSGAQQSYLQQVSGLALGGGKTLSDSLGQATSELAKLGDQYGQIGLNKANIIQGFSNSTNAARQSSVQNAGNSAAGDYLQGAAIKDVAGGIGKLGGALGAIDWGGGSKASPPLPGMSSGFSGAQLQMPSMGYGSPSPGYSLGANLGNSVSQPAGLYGSQPSQSYGWSPQSQTYLGRE